MPDAIVIGAGPNGLVAANLLADEGWDVVVLEAAPEPGGAVRSGELVEPGFVNDYCSAFYPLGAGSPVMIDLHLEEHGLRWLRAPLVLAHPAADGTCPSLSTDLDETARSFDELGPGDGDAWRRLYSLWQAQNKNILDAVFTPFPPVRAGVRLARSMSWRDLIRFGRFAVIPVRRLGDEHFTSPGVRRLLAGMALHADLLPESSLGGFYGWLLGALGQDVGWPVPEGGAGRLTEALVRRLESRGGRVQCNERVDQVIVRRGQAVGVRTAGGDRVTARRAVIADVDAPSLFLKLLPEGALPPSIVKDIHRFEWDHATVKVDWALDAPIPWSAEPARRAGTVHVTESVDALSVTASELARGLIPERPFVLLGQQSMTDPTRAPAGKEAPWAYTHVPSRVRGDNGGDLTGAWDTGEVDRFVDRMEAEIEALAPGFRDLIRGRHIQSPLDFERENSNLFRGALGGGTSQLHQQLVFRPIPGMARAETPVRNLYLGSASAHPGGGVHGACGANAAKAALTHWRGRRAVKAVRWVADRKKDRPSIVP